MADQQVVKFYEGDEVSVEAEGMVVESFLMPRSAELAVAARGDASVFVFAGRFKARPGAPAGHPTMLALLESGAERGVVRYGEAAAAVTIGPA